MNINMIDLAANTTVITENILDLRQLRKGQVGGGRLSDRKQTKCHSNLIQNQQWHKRQKNNCQRQQPINVCVSCNPQHIERQ